MINWLKQHRLALLIGVADALLAALLAVVIGQLFQTEPIQTAPFPAKSETQALQPPVTQLKAVAGGFVQPTVITAAPKSTDRRIFIVEQGGIIKIIQADGSVAAQPFLDISSKVLNSGEMGLLGLAFSPNYANDGNFFINYIDKNQNTIIARYHASADKADPASQQVFISLKQPYKNHNGGALLFGPDGYLYVALGDGGSGGDPGNRAQNLNSLFGKLLRLDVSQLPYKVPPSNPLVGQAGKLPEIWDYGLRNPWRISFDRQTGELYIADVGQGDMEEVNLEPADSQGGINYGWRCFEGSSDFNPSGCLSRDNYTFPILEYDHSEDRCSVTGGYIYRGQKYPALAGKYFYGDFCGGQLYLAGNKEGKWQSELITKSPYQISTFGEDSRGELYLADYAAGNIYQIQDSAN